MCLLNVVTCSAIFTCTTEISSYLEHGWIELIVYGMSLMTCRGGLCLVIAAMLSHIFTHMLPCWKVVNMHNKAQGMEHSTLYYAERLCRGLVRRFNIPVQERNTTCY